MIQNSPSWRAPRTECMATRPLLTPLVLLVNDALDEREMYARILRASGYQAIEAATFTAAYQIAITRRIDIVATDVRIGGSISGLELTRRLRNDERTSTVPIIVLTDVSRPQDADVAVKAGADTFLEKPVSDSVLKAEIIRLLRLSRPLGSPSLDAASLRHHTDADSMWGGSANPGHRIGPRGPCPWCGAAMVYRDRWPVLVADRGTLNSGNGRERLRYGPRWLCTRPSCDYFELP
jgi:two-component system, cell cycle response regulator DivK